MTARRLTPIVLALTAACGVNEPELVSTSTVSGTVTIGGAPATAGEAQVFLFDGTLQGRDDVATDASGRYELAVDTGDEVCQWSVVAWAVATPFPLETDMTVVNAEPDARCTGRVSGPDLALEARPPVLVPLDVSGVVTLNGAPVELTLSLVIRTDIWGPTFVADTESAVDGTYHLHADVPAYYCDDLTLYTELAAQPVLTLEGCGDVDVDVAITG